MLTASAYPARITKERSSTTLFEKPILNLVKFDMKDICTASNPGDEPAPEPTTTFNCGTDTGFIG